MSDSHDVSFVNRFYYSAQSAISEYKRRVYLFFSLSLLALLSLLFIAISSFTVKAQAFDWAVQVGGNNAELKDSRTIAMDKWGNIYIAGTFLGTADFDPGTGTAQFSSIGGAGDLFLSKYTPDGKYLWAKRILYGTVGRNSASLYAYDLAIDLADRVCVTGNFNRKVYFNTTSGVDSIGSINETANTTFFAQYDDKGEHIWTKYLQQRMGTSNSGRGVAVDREGNIYLTGIFSGTIDFDPGSGIDTITSITNTTNNTNLFIAKYDSNGEHIWARGVGGNVVQGFAITVDTTGDKNDIYTIGQFAGTVDFDPGINIATLSSAGGMDVFVAKYNSEGEYAWAIGMGGGNNDQGMKIACGQSGDIYITGTYIGGGDFDPGPDTAILTGGGVHEGFIAKYDSSGNYVWAGSIGGNNNSAQVYTQGLSLDQFDNLYVAGTFYMDGVDFDPGPDTAILYSAIADVFLAKYDACGQYVWAGRMGAPSPNFGTDAATGASLVVTREGTAYVTGQLNGSVDFDPGIDTFLLTAIGRSDIFLSQLTFTDTPSTVTYRTISACGESYTFEGVVYTSSGIYTQIIPVTGNCDSFIILDLTLNQIEQPVISVDGFTLSVAGTYTAYQWIKDGVPIPGATASTYTVTENGDYQVVVTDEAGCADTSEVYKVDNTNIEVFPGQTETVRIYPNPSHGIVYIQSQVPVKVMLIDVSGRVVGESKLERSVSFKNLAKGIYYLQVTDKDGHLISYQKLVSL